MNRLLIITEKCHPIPTQRDGGARLVETMKQAFQGHVDIMQFGSENTSTATWAYDYPNQNTNRFNRRLTNGSFIAEKVLGVAPHFTHLLFVHVSMQFGLYKHKPPPNIKIWTFPMFLTPSYEASGEQVPAEYTQQERLVLSHTDHILTPSHLEKKQLIKYYSVPSERIHMVPRGVNTTYLVPKTREFQGPVHFCSIGSIKPQKNILGLVQLFANLRKDYSGATLKVIGPIQDQAYFDLIQQEIAIRGLGKKITFTGYIAPENLTKETEGAHLHLSASTCETFGRSIFETLALGLPNIALASENAAAEFLRDAPYAHFLQKFDHAPQAIQNILSNLPLMSSMAQEVGGLYNDKWLAQLLAATINNTDPIGITDFDGTLYHKENVRQTEASIQAFRKFKVKVVCSARGVDDLLYHLAQHKLEVDWIIGCSGAIVADGQGNVLWTVPLSTQDLSQLPSHAQPIYYENTILQVALPADQVIPIPGYRFETYQGTTFIARWEASKLRAALRLLHHIGWTGRVQTFGDGPYDVELLTYFDGALIKKNTQQKELLHV